MGRTIIISFLLALAVVSPVLALPGPKVSENGNKHNLRSSNSGAGITYRAQVNAADRRHDEICIFCHTPHNASPSTPLWGRKPTVVSSFGHYSSTSLVIDNPGVRTTSDYKEPNGSSRLCLSCHDGATALGAVLYGTQIPMVAGKDKIERSYDPGRYNVFNPNNPVTGVPEAAYDATNHHHPVSFIYDNSVKSSIQSIKGGVYNYPPTEANVKLDRKGYLQCTTCHNPHQDQSGMGATVPFWVLGKNVSAADDYNTVCLSCHPSVPPDDPPNEW